MSLLSAYLRGAKIEVVRYAQTPTGLLAVLNLNGSYVTRLWNCGSSKTSERLLEALQGKNLEALLTEDDLYRFFERVGQFTLKDGKAYYKDEAIHPVLARRILHFLKEGKSLEPFCLFIERLRTNPSEESIETFYEVLDRYKFPILPDGRFLGYKAVKRDYYDCHTGKTFRYLVGTKHSEARSEVNNDRKVGCGKGIHVGAFTYAKDFGGESKRLMGVACCPSNVVVVPEDCSWQKIRLSEVEIIKEFETFEELYDSLVDEYGEQFVSEGGQNLLVPKVEVRVQRERERETYSELNLDDDDDESEAWDDDDDGSWSCPYCEEKDECSGECLK